MITINGVQLRNLEEQVQKNKEDIARHYTIDRVLADFGIRVLGYKENPTQLPGPDAQRPYGDAWLVGTGAPYNVYIWTRANPDAGEPYDYWLNIGPIAIEGPRGPQGVPGPQGPAGQGTVWYSGELVPSASFGAINDFYLLTTTGDVYKKQSDGWILQTNIKGPQGDIGPQGPQGLRGPQGLQGPKGDTGTPGQAVRIVGKLTNISQLPTASAAYVGKGYLISSGDITYIYIVREDNGTYQWINAGIFTGATIVSVNGGYVQTWNADTKLDKVSSVTDNAQLYLKNKGGTNTLIDLSPGNTVVNGSVARYSGTGTLRTRNATNTADAVPLNQMNTAIATAKSEIQTSLDAIERDLGSVQADIANLEGDLAEKSDKLYRHTIVFKNQDTMHFDNASTYEVDVNKFHMTFYYYSTKSTPMTYTEIYNLMNEQTYGETGVTRFTTLPKYVSFNAYDTAKASEAFQQVLAARQADQFIFWAMSAQVSPQVRSWTLALPEIYNDNGSWFDVVQEV